MSNTSRCARGIGSFEWPFGLDWCIDHQRFGQTILVLGSDTEFVVLAVFKTLDVTGGARDRWANFNPLVGTGFASFDNVMFDIIATIVFLNNPRVHPINDPLALVNKPVLSSSRCILQLWHWSLPMALRVLWVVKERWHEIEFDWHLLGFSRPICRRLHRLVQLCDWAEWRRYPMSRKRPNLARWEQEHAFGMDDYFDVHTIIID